MNYIEQMMDYSDLYIITDQFEEDYRDLKMCLSHLQMDSSYIEIDYRYLKIHSRNWSWTLGTFGLILGTWKRTIVT